MNLPIRPLRLLMLSAFWYFFVGVGMEGLLAQGSVRQDQSSRIGSSAISGGSIRYSAADAAHNLYVLGNFTGVFTLPNSTAPLTSRGYADLFLAKYNSAGILEWSRHIGSQSEQDYEIGLKIVGDNVYIAGGSYVDGVDQIYGSSPKIFQSSATNTFNALGIGVYVANYDPSGNLRWVSNAGASVDSYTFPGGTCDLVADAEGVYVTGMYQGYAQFGIAPNTQSLTDGQVYIAKLSPGGNPLWIRNINLTITGGFFGDPRYLPKLAINGQHVYLQVSTSQLVSFTSTNTFTPTTGQLLATYTTNGTWVSASSLALPSGVDGLVHGFNAADTTLYIVSTSTTGDAFLSRHSLTGQQLWTKTWQTATSDPQNVTVANLFVNQHDVYISGSFRPSTLSFGEATHPDNILTSAGLRDAFLVKYNTSGALQWARKAGGDTDSDISGGIVLVENKLYWTGRVRGTAGFSGDAVAIAGAEAFIAQYSESGQFQQVATSITVPGGHDDLGNIVADAANNLYIAGTFRGITDVNGGYLRAESGSDDAFLVKYNAQRQLQWARRIGGAGTDKAFGLAIGGDHLYLTGSFEGTINFNTPSEQTSNTLVSAGGQDAFVAKYDLDGNFVWAKRAGGTGADAGTALAANSSELYVTGYFSGTANFNTPSATSNQLISAGNTDAFVAKYGIDGTLMWIRRAGGTLADTARAIAVQGPDVYVAGGFRGTANFNTPSSGTANTLVSAGQQDSFLAKFGADGQVVWLRRNGGSSNDQANGIALRDSVVYLIGHFGGLANFNTPSNTGTNTLSGTTTDGYLAKYHQNGQLVWTRKTNNPATSLGITPNGSYINVLTSDGSGYVLYQVLENGSTQYEVTKFNGTTHAWNGKLFVTNQYIYFAGPFNGTIFDPNSYFLFPKWRGTFPGSDDRDIAIQSFTDCSIVLTINTSQLSQGMFNQPYSMQITATPADVVFDGVSGLPPGLSLNSAGLLSGTPTTWGTFPVTINIRQGQCQISKNFTLTILQGTTWNGATWSHGEPNNTLIAIIDANYTTQQPSFVCRSIFVNAGDTLHIGSNQTVSVHRQVNVDGHITGPGTLQLLGTDTQTAVGTGTIANLGSINVNRSNTFTFEVPVSLTDRLTLTSGTLNPNGNLTLRSTSPTATATIIGGSNTSITGNITFERFLKKDRTIGDYKFIAQPTRANITFSAVTGLNPTAFNVITLNEALIGSAQPGAGWVSAGGPTAQMVPGRGYAHWVSNDKTIAFTGLPQLNNFTTPTLSFTTSVPEQLRGFNLIGNPFPSVVDLNAITRSNVAASFYVYNHAADLYWAWTQNGGTGIGVGTGNSRYIAPGQAFIVKATAAAATLTFPATARVAQTAAHFRTAQPARLVLSAPNGHDYETVVRFAPDATPLFDPELDALFMAGSLPETPIFASKAGDDKLLLNTLPDNQTETQVPIIFQAGTKGQHQFSFHAGQLQPGTTVHLADYANGTMTDLLIQPQLTFEAGPQDAAGRFALIFNAKANRSQHAAIEEAFLVSAHQKTVSISFTDENLSGTAEIIDVTGRTIAEAKNFQGAQAFRFDLPNAPAGCYIIRVHTHKGTAAKRVILE